MSQKSFNPYPNSKQLMQRSSVAKSGTTLLDPNPKCSISASAQQNLKTKHVTIKAKPASTHQEAEISPETAIEKNQENNNTTFSNRSPTTDTRIRTQSSTNTNSRFQIGLKFINHKRSSITKWHLKHSQFNHNQNRSRQIKPSRIKHLTNTSHTKFTQTYRSEANRTGLEQKVTF